MRLTPIPHHKATAIFLNLQLRGAKQDLVTPTDQKEATVYSKQQTINATKQTRTNIRSIPGQQSEASKANQDGDPKQTRTEIQSISGQ